MSEQLLPRQKYRDLVNFLKKTLRQTRLQAFEGQKPQHYWAIGHRLFQEKKKLKPKQGEALVDQLRRELEIERSHFYRMLQFYQTWPGGLPTEARGLSWTHFRWLLSLPDAKQRKFYLNETLKHQWNNLTLHKAIEHDLYNSQDQTKTHHKMKQLKRPQPGVYFYSMEVTRVIDGDTLEGILDAGFDMLTRRKFRLRGINTPELKGKNSEAALLAKNYVEQKLNTAARVMVRSYKTDLHGRFVIELLYHPVYTDKQEVIKKGFFLNQELLDEGLAELMEG